MKPTTRSALALAFTCLFGLAVGACASEPADETEAEAATGAVRYEAEAATSTTNLPTETVWPGYSGKSYVCCWSSQGQYITFNVNAPSAGTYALAFGYSAGNGAAGRELQINGATIANNQTFAGTANWSTWTTLNVSAQLHAGANTVTLTFNSADGSSNYINIDYLDVTPPGSSPPPSNSRYEAESQTATNLPTETVWPGFSGASYRCCWSSQGQYITFAINVPAAGSYTLAFGYSAGNGAASRQLKVNGSVVSGNESFPGTANWSTWGRTGPSVSLAAGANTVTLTFDSPSGSSNYINIDYLDVTSSGGTTPPPGVTKIDDNDTNYVIYSKTGSNGQWNFGGGGSDFDGDEHYNNGCSTPVQPLTPVQGPMAVVNFNGTGVTLIGKKGNNYGIGAWAIDGGPLTTVDAYDPAANLYQQNLVNVTGLSAGSHTLSYQVTCNKNPASSNTYQVIDGYSITGSPLAVSSAQVGAWNQVTLGGTWSSGMGPTNLSGGQLWSGTAGNTISWSFSGSLIEVYGRPDVGDGFFNVIIDGVQVATNVDTHYEVEDNDLLTGYMMWAKKIAPGNHNITLVVTGTEDSYNEAENSGQKYLVQFDEFLAFP